MLNTTLTKFISLTTLTLTLSLATACSPTLSEISSLENSGSTQENTDSATPPQIAPPASGYVMEALSWESTSQPQRRQWSLYLQNIISDEWSSLLDGSDDMDQFCPNYDSLNNDERANVWAALFSAISKFESNYSPTSRMQETTMGTDPVTRQPVYSEGLLQLSYQDIQWADWCDFEWSKDKNLSPTSPQKTILDPYRNLNCGVGIMAQQVRRTGRILLNSGVYWAVIKLNGSYQKISQITSMVRQLSLCQ